MQITLLQGQNILQSSIFGQKLPGAISYKFAKLAKLLQAEMETVESQRRKLIEEAGGTLPEGSNQYIFPEGGEASFQVAFKEVLDSPLEIGVHFPMAVPNLEFAPAELIQLEPLFDMPDTTVN